MHVDQPPVSSLLRMRESGASSLLLYSFIPSSPRLHLKQYPAVYVCIYACTSPPFPPSLGMLLWNMYCTFIHRRQAPLVVTMELASIATKAFHWLARAPSAAPAYTLNKTTATTLRSILVSDFLQLHCPFYQSLFYSLFPSLSLLCDLPDTAICVPSPMPG